MVLPVIPAAYSLVQTAAGLSAMSSAAKAGADAAKFHNRGKSLVEKARQSFISSRAYVDKSLENNEITPNLLNVCHSFLIGLVTTAVHLENHVTAARTVSDFLAPIQSMESYTDVADVLIESTLGLEAAVAQLNVPNRPAPASCVSTEAVTHTKVAAGVETDKTANRAPAPLSITASKVTEAQHLPMGKVIEVELTSPTTNAKTVVPITVRLAPFFMDSQTMAHIFGNYGEGLSFEQRKLMVKAGEHTFWADFIGQKYRVKKLEQDLARDTRGELHDVIMQGRKKSRFRIMETLAHATGLSHNSPTSNLANAIYIASEETMIRAKSEGAGDFDNYAVRQKFFDSAYALAIFVVDTRHDRVRIYINSIKDVAEYPFSTFRPKKEFNTTDMMKLMGGLAAGRASVF